MDVLTPEQRRKNMRAIKNKNTKIEELLAKALWAKGYRYRRNNKTVIGTPDFTFRKYKIAIFCDSEFFHGKDWDTLENNLGTKHTLTGKCIDNLQKHGLGVTTRVGLSVIALILQHKGCGAAVASAGRLLTTHIPNTAKQRLLLQSLTQIAT